VDAAPAAAGSDVLGSPLLALLAFRTVAAWRGATGDLFARPTALYNALIEITVANAGKADEGPQGTVHRGGRSLRRLLQQVAAVITTQGEESVSFEELRLRLDDDGALADWAEEATNESALHELVVNFYFKSHRELGCEFLHKSFREYLFAEAVVATLERVSEGRRGPRRALDHDEGQDFVPATPEFAASRSLAALLGPQWLTPEVRSHVFWLVSQGMAADPDRWVWIRGLMRDLYAWWFGSAHLRPNPVRRRGRLEWEPPSIIAMVEDDLPRDGRTGIRPRRTVSIDAHLGEGLLQLTAFVHHELARGEAAGDGDHDGSRFEHAPFRPRIWLSDDLATRRSVARMSAAYGRPEGPDLAGAYLRGVDLAGDNLAGLSLANADLEEARLEGAVAPMLQAGGADLTRADLRSCLLRGADLYRACLHGADLTGVEAALVNLAFADLRGAKLARANLRGAHLHGADLGGADLSHAVLSLADLREANLAGADLTGADLTDANLEGANMPAANLCDADVLDARFRGANLRAAGLAGVRLADADVRDVDLRGAHLTGVWLEGANLDGALLDPS
jgi:uncharacterized protein YjbI with pentapeptide repeats